LEEEMAVARQIQLSLLPETPPAVTGWEFAAYYCPARQVGGDFYDFFELPGQWGGLGMVIADVADKGVPAALLMALSRSIIRTKAMTPGFSPAEVLMRANRLIMKDSRSKLFLTACYATLDPETGRLVYALAGHNRPLWLRAATGECLELMGRGAVLGIFEDLELAEFEIDLSPGDLLVFYTDGVTEAMNDHHQLFGEERLAAVIATNPAATPGQMLQAIVEAVNTFTGGAPQTDDLTLFVVKRASAQ
jgi:sigma-B regulation protein RsbU (phosphoserine phosphatase)